MLRRIQGGRRLTVLKHLVLPGTAYLVTMYQYTLIPFSQFNTIQELMNEKI